MIFLSFFGFCAYFVFFWFYLPWNLKARPGLSPPADLRESLGNRVSGNVNLHLRQVAAVHEVRGDDL